MNRTQEWWDRYFLGLAKYISTASKDPSTQTGAVIVDNLRRVVSTGYNGFARGLNDDPDRYANREFKYSTILHCEENAILFARAGLSGCTLYTYPFGSCSKCAGMVIQSGISRAVFPTLPDALRDRWGASTDLSRALFNEVGITITELPSL